MCRTILTLTLLSIIFNGHSMNCSYHSRRHPRSRSRSGGLKPSENPTTNETQMNLLDEDVQNEININNPSRLPKSILPEKYMLNLSTDIENLKFYGDITIRGRRSNEVTNKRLIVLNAVSLNITDVKVSDITHQRSLNISASTLVNTLQWFVIELNEDLHPSPVYYEIYMEFTGNIQEENGLYMTTYNRGDNTRRPSPVVTTEFQPTYARRVFPCWDEPMYKASFLIRVSRKMNQVALSNMPLNYSSEPDHDGMIWDTFQESPSMSTYLVAIIIGDLEKFQAEDKSNISIWTQPGEGERGRFALHLTSKILEKLEEYTELEYFLPKLDQVAVSSLNSEAMENWGIITYEDNFLLLEFNDSLEEKMNVAYHISHEISHQWFGNLVTFEWWNNVWLNEGFAQFFQYYILDLLEPDWRTMDRFVVSDLQYILEKDAYSYGHPISGEYVDSVKEINEMFDSISYLKGGSIVRMLYHIVTPELFQKWIARYIEVNALKSVTDNDLWDSFREVENSELDLPADIAEIMYNWVHEKGYPVIEMERVINDSVPIHQIKLKQRYYMNEESKMNGHTQDTRWWIPLSYTTSIELEFNETEPKEWFNMTSEEHTLSICLEEDEWIILNLQLSGFYRVNYDPLTWKLIIDDMVDYGYNDIHPLNRAALLNDAFNLAFSGHLDLDIAMNLTRYLIHETDSIPWIAAQVIFTNLDQHVWNSPSYPLLQKYVRWLVSCWSNKIGFEENENDTISTKLDRLTLIDIACSFELDDCHEKALEQVYLMMSQAEVNLSTDLQNSYLCVAVTAGSSEVWQYVRKLYMESTTTKWRASLLNAMACSKDNNIIIQMLRDSIDAQSYLKGKDGGYLIGAIISKIVPKNLDLVLNFFSDNLEEIINIHKETKVVTYFLRMALKSNNIGMVKIEKFINKHKHELGGIGNSIKNKLKYTGSNVLNEEQLNQLFNWLKAEEIDNERFDEKDDEDITDIDDDFEVKITSTDSSTSTDQITTDYNTDSTTTEMTTTTASDEESTIISDTKEITTQPFNDQIATNTEITTYTTNSVDTKLFYGPKHKSNSIDDNIVHSKSPILNSKISPDYLLALILIIFII